MQCCAVHSGRSGERTRRCGAIGSVAVWSMLQPDFQPEAIEVRGQPGQGRWKNFFLLRFGGYTSIMSDWSPPRFTLSCAAVVRTRSASRHQFGGP